MFFISRDTEREKRDISIYIHIYRPLIENCKKANQTKKKGPTNIYNIIYIIYIYGSYASWARMLETSTHKDRWTEIDREREDIEGDRERHREREKRYIDLYIHIYRHCEL